MDSEAAWEAAQKAAAQNTAVSVDFNPYDPETGNVWVCGRVRGVACGFDDQFQGSSFCVCVRACACDPVSVWQACK